jgi:hypothetical protein
MAQGENKMSKNFKVKDILTIIYIWKLCISNSLHKDKTIDIIEQNVHQTTMSKGKKSQVDLKQKKKKLW